MRHPTDGTLRRLLDEPVGVADTDREHVASCPQCRAGLATARLDADAAHAALGRTASGPLDVDAAWERLSRSVADGPHRRRAEEPAPAPSRRRRAGLRSPVVAAVGVLALVTGAGAAAAGDWLQIFRTEQIATVPLTEADLVQLPDLSSFGDVEVVQEPDVRQVADADAAEEVSGLPVPEVAQLPRGVGGNPTYRVGEEVRAVFTFSAAQVAESTADGDRVPPPPAGLDGSRFRLVAGPGLAAVWSSDTGLPALVVARAVAPTAYSSGVDFETARDYLLSLPGVPDDVATQLRSFTGDGTTLPLPVPGEEVTSSPTEVGGVPATLFTLRDGTAAGVVWVEDGIVTAVAGSLGEDEVLAVAGGLR